MLEHQSQYERTGLLVLEHRLVFVPVLEHQALWYEDWCWNTKVSRNGWLVLEHRRTGILVLEHYPAYSVAS